jgi:hypothetical protein
MNACEIGRDHSTTITEGGMTRSTCFLVLGMVWGGGTGLGNDTEGPEKAREQCKKAENDCRDAARHA